MTAVASLTPVLYLAYVIHYSVNALQGDDWNTVQVVSNSLHGRLTAGEVWSQYFETRIPLIRVIYILFVHLDSLNLRSIIVTSALIYIAAYVVLLGLGRCYLQARLTPVSTLIIGSIWFSLADVQTSLWAFQIGWYIVVFCFVAMVYALIAGKSRRILWVASAILLAVFASLAFVQGFILWPIGAVCIVWAQPWSRRISYEIGFWSASFLLSLVVYLHKFDTHQTGCIPDLGCKPGVAYSHPFEALRYFVVLIGNVIPGGYFGSDVRSVVRWEVVGTALFLCSLFIIVQSWRRRTSSDASPIPLLIVSFGFLFDAMIALGRTGAGLDSAVNSNRYVLANLILLTGIVMYGWKRLPHLGQSRGVMVHNTSAQWITLGAFMLCIVVQVSTSTIFGLRAGEADHALMVESGQLAVNFDRIPPSEQTCERLQYFLPTRSVLRIAAENHLGEFSKSVFSYYRKLGLPDQGSVSRTSQKGGGHANNASRGQRRTRASCVSG